jgi:nucleotide-binding universal stress UspA family protein
MDKTILVPVDFKPESLTALDYAVHVSQSIQAEIHLLYVIEIESPLLKMVLTDEQRELIVEGAGKKMDTLIAEKSHASDRIFHKHILQGKIYNKIVETAMTIKAELIIMGRKDSSDMVKNFTGTNTLHIIRESNIPVVTLKKETTGTGCKHILLPLDLSKQVFKQVCNSIHMARLFSASVSIVSALTVDSASLEIKYSVRLNELRALFEQSGIPCQYALIRDPAPDLPALLNRHAREIKADMVIIMTQQELNFTDYFIGSTAQVIINTSDIPVLSITPTVTELDSVPDEFISKLVDPINILKY